MDWQYIRVLVWQAFLYSYKRAFAFASFFGFLSWPFSEANPSVEGALKMFGWQVGLVIFGCVFAGIILFKISEVLFDNRKALLNKKESIQPKAMSKVQVDAELPKLELYINSKHFRKMNAKQIIAYFTGIEKVLAEYRRLLQSIHKRDNREDTQ